MGAGLQLAPNATSALRGLGLLGRGARVACQPEAWRSFEAYPIAVTAVHTGLYGVPAALGAAMACFLIRLAGIRYNLNAPIAPEAKTKE